LDSAECDRLHDVANAVSLTRTGRGECNEAGEEASRRRQENAQPNGQSVKHRDDVRKAESRPKGETQQLAKRDGKRSRT
jgi:hypothetical protein